MATSSITKNFVVYGEKQAEIFANAIEESFKEREYRGKRVPRTKFVKGSENVAKFFKD